MILNILGSDWTVEYRNADADPILLDGNGGYTDSSINLIVISNRKQNDDCGNLVRFKRGIFAMKSFMRFFMRVDWVRISRTRNLGMMKLMSTGSQSSSRRY